MGYDRVRPGEVTKVLYHCNDPAQFTVPNGIVRVPCGKQRHSDRHHRRILTDRKGRRVTITWADPLAKSV